MAIEKKIAMTLGFVYLLTSIDSAARLVVSLFALRKRFSGEVTIFVTRQETRDVVASLSTEKRLAPIRIEELAETKVDPDSRMALTNASYATKVLAIDRSPYDATIFLDADTIVVGDISPLMDSARSNTITVTAFANWRTTDTHYRKHFESWKELAESTPEDGYLNRKLELLMSVPTPVINTGVVAVQGSAAILEPWKALTEKGKACHIPDEMALQLLLSDYAHHRLGPEFNASPNFVSDAILATLDVRVWHFANATHLRDARSREIWLPAYDECCKLNLAGISRWSRITRPND